jgi:hypothetical protein
VMSREAPPEVSPALPPLALPRPAEPADAPTPPVVIAAPPGPYGCSGLVHPAPSATDRACPHEHDEATAKVEAKHGGDVNIAPGCEKARWLTAKAYAARGIVRFRSLARSATPRCAKLTDLVLANRSDRIEFAKSLGPRATCSPPTP